MGGFDEAFERAGSDVDLCLRLRRELVRHLYTPFAAFRYRKSVDVRWGGSSADEDRLREQHGDLLAAGDPYYNLNLATDRLIPHLRLKNPPSPPPPEIAVSQYRGTWSAYSTEAEYLTHLFDFDEAALTASQKLQQDHADALDLRSITWFIPGFTHAFYGGIHTILRFASYFGMAHGVENRFVVLNGEAAPVERAIKAAFPDLDSARVEAIFSPEDVKRLKPTDAGICTFWTTAYALLRFNQTQRKFYFIQDMEPLFYPAGSISGLIEASYRFGFYGLINTPGLKVIYERDYQGRAEAFIPAINAAVFHPPTAPQSPKPPYRVFFYGRPEHPRNAFELGAVSLRKLKRSMGKDVQIVAAGAEWKPADYGLEGVVENLGVLRYEATADLYRTCHAGLVMMFTRHPSYLPMELMACGSLVVTNHNAYTEWLLKDRENCLLTEASASAIAQTLELGLRDDSLRQSITTNAAEMVLSARSNWQGEMANIYAFMRGDMNT